MQSSGVKLNSAGSGIYWSFPVINGYVNDIAVDPDGNAYYAEGLEVFSNSYNNGIKIRKISAGDGTVVASETLNGIRRDYPTGIAFGGGYVYVVGYTSSLDFPTTDNAIQPQSRAINSGSSLQGFLAKIQINAPPRNPLIFIPGAMGSELYRKETDEKYWARWGSIFSYNSYLTLDSQSSYFLGDDAFEARNVFRKVRYDGQIPIILGSGLPSGTIPVGFEVSTVYQDLLRLLKMAVSIKNIIFNKIRLCVILMELVIYRK